MRKIQGCGKFYTETIAKLSVRFIMLQKMRGVTLML